MKKIIIHSEASNRILDFGGWSDTHFAKQGKVLNFAVSLYANVTLSTRSKPGVAINVVDYGEMIEVEDISELIYNGHLDLLKAALKVMDIRRGLEIQIWADVPAGASTGSSAAVSVALINALSLLKKKPLVPHELADLAHRIETEELGWECGIQDQIAAAMGGINFIDMYEYPYARVSGLPVSEDTINQLNTQLILVYEGEGHLSSPVHQKVIANLKNPRTKSSRALAELKTIAERAKAALMNRDMASLARVMNRNHELQTQLHPNIATPRTKEIRRIAMKQGATAVKINGAGGGGSVTVLCEPGRKAVLAHAFREAGYRILPFRLNMNPAKAWFVQR